MMLVGTAAATLVAFYLRKLAKLDRNKNNNHVIASAAAITSLDATF